MNYRNIVQWIFEKKNPEKISEIDNLLTKYAGVEQKLLKAVYEKYMISNDEIEKLENGINPFIDINDLKSNESKVQEIYQEVNSTKKKFSKLLVFVIIGFILVIVLVVVLVFVNKDSILNTNNNVKNQSVEVTEQYAAESFSVGQTVIATKKRVYFHSEANANSITEAFFVVGQEAYVTDVADDFIFVSFNYNGEITKGYLAKTDVVAKSDILDLTVTSSSYMESQSEFDYLAYNVADDDLETWWSPAKASKDEWVKLSFEKTWINGIKIHAGSHFPDYKNYGNLYYQNCRIKKAKLEFSDGSTEIIDIPENDIIQTIFFTPRHTKYVKLFPISWSKGNSWQDLCVSHFMAF